MPALSALRNSCTTVAAILALQLSVNAQHHSQWVYADANGKLAYKTLPKGDKIMDFSYAGYMGGGVRIPVVPVQITIEPTAGDNTDLIQQAIDKVAGMPLRNGFRGTVLLSAGNYDCERAININTTGIVLRGSGSGEKGTIINMTGKPHVAVAIKGNVNYSTGNITATVTDDYIPSGALSFTVNKASAFAAGDTIRLTKKVTPEWVQFMGMDQMVRDGKQQTWVSGEFTTDRVIRKISGNTITVDVPLTDSYDTKFTGQTGTVVSKVSATGEISQVGVENLRIVSGSQSVTINDGHNRGLTINGAADAWIRDLVIFNTVNSITLQGKRITAENINLIHDVPTLGAAKPADLSANGSQLLFNKCNITGDNVFYLATGAKINGPIVLLNCVFRGNGWIQPHQRWATGLLVDNCNVPTGGIDFMNRGSMGSGHGWAIGWAVAWNCTARSYLNQQPPGAANWVIGSKGEHKQGAIPFEKDPMLPEGIYDSPGTPVAPNSLYLAQLNERLGAEAVKNTGY
ncbi:MAG: hypothetical protein QM731_00035 [Chitinophagaceae bacterium]